MKNVLIVTDKKNSAIWRLAKGVETNLPHLSIRVIAVHPKRPDPEQINNYNEGVKWADVIDYAYWKSAVALLDKFPNNKPKILQHHNPYNLHESDWSQFKKIVVNNKSMQNDLKGSILIGNTIDLNLFKYQREYPENSKTIIMVAARIESKKGILEVAQVCKELNYKLLLVGSISDPDYFNKIMTTGIVDFRENIPDGELVKCYHQAAIHICNSVDNFESSNNPVLEAMATGVPVITRRVGVVPDIYNGFNMIVRKGQPEDISDLKTEIVNLMNDLPKRKNIREDAWKTVKTRGNYRRAIEYERLYWQVFSPMKDLVSIIIPTFNRKELLAKVIGGCLLQDWEAKEIIIADDGSWDGTRDMVMALQSQSKVPIKYTNTNMRDRYGLALARNQGIIEASGEVVVFLDDRYYPEPQMISEFLKHLNPKTWLYGNKGKKKDFVENVSCCYRQDIIDAGMFNFTVQLYGFQTQELRNRFRAQSWQFKFIENAKAQTLATTKSKYTKKDEIRVSKDLLWKLNL